MVGPLVVLHFASPYVSIAMILMLPAGTWVGLFVPSLFTGAAIGRCVGVLIQASYSARTSCVLQRCHQSQESLAGQTMFSCV